MCKVSPRLRELMDEEDEVIDIETAREMVHEAIREEYARPKT